MSNLQNLEALRAKAAFDFANTKEAKNADLNYPAAVKELAAIIRMNGLRAAMAYFYSKENAHRVIFNQVKTWFLEKEPSGFLRKEPTGEACKNADAEKFMDILLKLNDDDYRIATAEMMALASWMIRFAKTPETSTNKLNTADEYAHQS